MEEEVRTWLGVRADSVIWLCVAVMLFAISGYLMLVVTHVERHPTQRGIALFAYASDAKDIDIGPDFAFSAENNSLTLVIQAVDAKVIKHILIGPFLRDRASDVNCIRRSTLSWFFAKDSKAGWLVPATPDEIEQTGLDTHLYHDQNAPLSYDIETTAEDNERLVTSYEFICHLPLTTVQHDTFTSRSFQIFVWDGRFISFEDLSGYRRRAYIAPRGVSFRDEDAQEIHVTNVGTGETRLASRLRGPYYGYDGQNVVRFTWDSITASEQRDIYIISIGFLIGLGASAILEAVRPYIEIAVHRRKPVPEKPLPTAQNVPSDPLGWF